MYIYIYIIRTWCACVSEYLYLDVYDVYSVRAVWCGTAPDYPLKGSWKMYFPRAYSEKLHPTASAHDHCAPYPSAGDAARYIIWLMDIVWVFPRSLAPLDGTDHTYSHTHRHTHTVHDFIICIYIWECVCSIYYNVLCMPDKTECIIYTSTAVECNPKSFILQLR